MFRRVMAAATHCAYVVKIERMDGWIGGKEHHEVLVAAYLGCGSAAIAAGR
jgi:hypothetical protein